MRLVAALDQLADRGHAGGAQQLVQLGEVVVLAGRHRGDHERALARAPARLRPSTDLLPLRSGPASATPRW